MEHKKTFNKRHSVSIPGTNRVEKRNPLIEEFYYEYFKNTNIDIDYMDFENICKLPFQYAKKKIASSALYEIRFKYLGRFIPAKGRVIKSLKQITEKYHAGKVSQSVYNKVVTMNTNYISSNVKQFRDVADEVKPWIDITEKVKKYKKIKN